MSTIASPPGVQILGPIRAGYDRVLTHEALSFVAALARQFTGRIEEALAARIVRQQAFDRGELPDFLEETSGVRESEWRVAPLPADILDRRVEITGPIDRKMIINALNSGASVFMADCEDATSPTWDNEVQGQINLCDAVRRTIAFTDDASGKSYKLNEKTAVLFVRPRGLHLWEKHVKVDGKFIPGSLFDFGLYFFHNAKEALARGTGPYFYLPKLESHREARIWNDVFVYAQKAIEIPRGSIKATVLIETLPATFELNEILWELRDHSAGLNCGRWDYIFSFIKKMSASPTFVMPDRGQVSMDKAFLRAYSLLVIQTCHRRGVHAMGGMAAVIPIKGDDAANNEAMAKVRADKLREVTDGHDGTWVAHPGLVPIAKAIFDEHMKVPNQIDRLRDDVAIGRHDLLRVHEGTRTEHGLRHNIRVGVQYIEAWLRGVGCVPLYNLMEDAATAEISRAQVWQWIAHHAPLADGSIVDAARFKACLADELGVIEREVGHDRFTKGRFPEAAELFERMSLSTTFAEFLTVPAYEQLLGNEKHL
jgi:malate synthase